MEASLTKSGNYSVVQLEQILDTGENWAMALFGEKYGKSCRVLYWGLLYELCGGNARLLIRISDFSKLF